MKSETALQRLVEDQNAPAPKRCEALKMLARPRLTMLRRLLADIPRPKPIPSKLKAIAAIAYAKELSLRKHQPRKRKPAASANPLGI